MWACTPTVVTFALIFVWICFLIKGVGLKGNNITTAEPAAAQQSASTEQREFTTNTTANPDNTIHDRSLQKVVELYKDQEEERRLHFRTVLNGTTPFSFGVFYNILVPEAYCPVLVRIGRILDGGKWICNPFRIPQKSIVFSLGLHNEISFEKELQRVTNNCCYIYGYDFFRQKNKTIMELTEVRAVTIAAKTYEKNDEYTIEYLMELENVTNIEILKMDIELTEHDVLPQFLDKQHPAQILVEIHTFPKDAVVMAKLVHEIAKRGYSLVSYEINGDHHDCSEFTFIHESAFHTYGAIPLVRIPYISRKRFFRFRSEDNDRYC